MRAHSWKIQETRYRIGWDVSYLLLVFDAYLKSCVDKGSVYSGQGDPTF